jgi:CBS domain containing-hemolysin-like protein
MVEIIVLSIGFILAILIAAVRSAHFLPGSISEFELLRRNNEGDKQAGRELKRRQLIPTFKTIKSFKIIILTLALVATLIISLPHWIGILASLGFLLLAQFIFARGWLARPVGMLQKKYDAKFNKILKKAAKFLQPFTANVVANEFSLNSMAELQQIIAGNQTVLSESEKTQLLAALKFDKVTIESVMVPRDKIITVGVGETVGPLLLDRLHKVGHNVFPVVDKSLNNIKGLLYMSDLVPLDPDLKEVKDAIRSTMHYVDQNSPVSEVLAASVKTGRQLFIVVNPQGKITGLVTLADVLKELLGSSIKSDPRVSTNPEKL